MAVVLLLIVIAAVIVYIISKNKKRQPTLNAPAQHPGQEQQYIAWATGHIQELESRLVQQEERHQKELELRGQRAVAASRGSFDGHTAQQAFPVSGQHPYHLKDIFYLGGVMDYLILDGLHDIRHNDRDPRTLTVVMAEVKWGTSRTSPLQQAVIQALNDGRVRGEAWHSKVNAQNSLSYERR